MLTLPERKLRRRGARTGPLSVAIAGTLAIHLVLALIALARSVLPEPVARPEIAVEAPRPERQREQEAGKEEIRRQVSQAVAKVSTLGPVVLAEPVATPVAREQSELLPGPIGLGEGDLGVGFGPGAGPDMGRGAVFFGQRVTGRMGVVFDVSGSMHDFVPLVIDEIKRGFRGATVVCCNPAALVPVRSKPLAVPYREANLKSCNLPSRATQTARKMHEELLTLPNCWFLLREFSHLGGGIEYLMNEGVQAIFVFSDFEDIILPEYVDGLAQRAQRGGVQINLQVLQVARYQKQALIDLCRRSGGAFAEGELLQRGRRR